MTREETKKIIMVMAASYPNYKPADLSMTVDAWQMMLGEYPYSEIALALKAYITSDRSGFAPSIGQLIEKLQTITGPQEMGELEAWSLVYKAVCNSGYHAESEFAKLPEACQRAVGNPANLKEWAMMDIDTVQSVEQSHFIRNYRAILNRMREEAKMPQEVKALIAGNRPEKITGKEAPGIEVRREHKGVPMPEELSQKVKEMFGTERSVQHGQGKKEREHV